MTTVLETRNLHKAFGAVVAAADINVQVASGEVVGLIGANGAGKTSFVNIVTGYLRPTTGQVLFEGRDITRVPPREVTGLGISRSFQMPQVMDDLSVLDNMLIALGISPSATRTIWRPIKRADTETAACDVLQRYGIDDYAERKAGALPQGVRKLLDIAMTMASEPRLVILDEPTSGVSVDEKFAVMDTLMDALRESDVTLLFVEHDMEVVERYARRVLAFYEGRVVADDVPERAFADPQVRAYVLGTAVAESWEETADASRA